MTDSLSELTEIKNKLNVLEEEIEAVPNVETLRDVIKSSNKRQNEIEEAIDASIDKMPSAIRFTIIFLRFLGKVLVGISFPNK